MKTGLTSGTCAPHFDKTAIVILTEGVLYAGAEGSPRDGYELLQAVFQHEYLNNEMFKQPSSIEPESLRVSYMLRHIINQTI